MGRGGRVSGPGAQLAPLAVNDWSWGNEREWKEKYEGFLRYYAFHDLRRGFASANALNMPADALQRLMRHQSYTTTQRYVNLARSMRDIVGKLTVPESARNGSMRETMRDGQEDASL